MGNSGREPWERERTHSSLISEKPVSPGGSMLLREQKMSTDSTQWHKAIEKVFVQRVCVQIFLSPFGFSELDHLGSSKLVHTVWNQHLFHCDW